MKGESMTAREIKEGMIISIKGHMVNVSSRHDMKDEFGDDFIFIEGVHGQAIDLGLSEHVIFYDWNNGYEKK